MHYQVDFSSLGKKCGVLIHMNESKKSGRKPITFTDEEKECIVSFIFILNAFFISNAFIINRQKMIYWFVNSNFNLMFSSPARDWRKKIKTNKKWAFILHLKNSSKKMTGGQFKTTCLRKIEWILMLETEHKNVKISSLCKNDGVMNFFYLFIYHEEECNKRERKS